MRNSLILAVTLLCSFNVYADSYILPDSNNYTEQEINSLYVRWWKKDPVPALRNMKTIANRVSGDNRILALSYLIVMELEGLPYGPNLEGAMRHLIELESTCANTKSSCQDAFTKIYDLLDEKDSQAYKNDFEYLKIAMHRRKYASYPGVLGVFADDLANVVSTANPRESFSEHPKYDLIYVMLKDLAEKGHAQANYDLGILYLSRLSRNVDPNVSRRLAFKYFALALRSGHVAAAEQAYNLLRETRSVENVHRACSIYIAFLSESMRRYRRKILFEKQSECGHEKNPKRIDPLFTKRLIDQLSRKRLYLGNVDPRVYGFGLWPENY